MPKWSPIPPALDEGVPFRLVRVPADKAIQGIVTSVEITGCATHFFNNRTVPCDGQGNCKSCTEGYAWRWHAYCSLLVSSTLEHVILELTAAGSETVRNYAQTYAGTRGCLLSAWRPSKKANGRLLVTCKPGDLLRLTLPEPPNVPRLLCKIWNVRYDPLDHVNSLRPGAKAIVPAPGTHGNGNGHGEPQHFTPEELQCQP